MKKAQQQGPLASNEAALNAQSRSGVLLPLWRLQIQQGQWLGLMLTVRRAVRQRLERLLRRRLGWDVLTAVQPLCAEVALQVMDVGAADGLAERWQILGPASRIWLVEPEPAALEKLRAGYAHDVRVGIIGSALSDKVGKATLNVLAWPRASSLYKPVAQEVAKLALCEHLKVAQRLPVACKKLSDFKDVTPDFIKLDVEGHELPILQGMSKAQWAGILGLEVEVVFNTFMFEGRPTFSTVDTELQRRGFVLAQLPQPHTMPWLVTDKRYDGEGFVYATDAIYFVRPEEVLVRVKSGEWGAEKVRAAACLYLSYGLVNWARKLLQELPAKVRGEAWWVRLDATLQDMTGSRYGMTALRMGQVLDVVLPL